MHHGYIGAEHLLLGILGVPDGPGTRALTGLGVDAAAVRDRVVPLGLPPGDDLDADALASVGIDLAEVRRATEANFGAGALDRPKPAMLKGHIPFDDVAKKTLELAVREAVHLKHSYICDGHVLLGMLRAAPNNATRILADLDVMTEDLSEAVRRELPDKAA